MLGARPLWDPILSFSHTFLAKSACVGGPRPLDPPLARIQTSLNIPLGKIIQRNVKGSCVATGRPLAEIMGAFTL